MSERDARRLDEVAQLQGLLDGLDAQAGWGALREQLVSEHLALTDDLVVSASKMSEAQLRDRIGELRGLQRIVTAEARLRVRLRKLEVTLTEKVRTERARAAEPQDELERDIENVREWLARRAEAEQNQG